MGTQAVRCLHLADLHIGWRPKDLGGKEEQRGRERDDLLRKAVDFALDPANGIDLVLIAGDLFETHNPRPHLVEEAIRQIGRLRDARVPVVTVPGNHDEITYNDSVYKVAAPRWPGVLVTCPQPELVAQVEIKGSPVFIYSLAYTGGVTRTSPPIRDFPRTGEAGIHIGVFHGSLGWDAGDRSLPIDAEALGRAGYNYVALGHFHGFIGVAQRATQRAPGKVAQTPGKPAVVYCGMVEARGFSDLGTGCFVVASIRPSEVEIQTIPAGACKCVSVPVDLTGVAGLSELETHLKDVVRQAGPGALLRISLIGNASFAFDTESLVDGARQDAFYLEVESDAGFLAAAEIDQWATEPTIRGEFIRRVRQRLATATSERDRAILEKALSYGLRALEGGAS